MNTKQLIARMLDPGWFNEQVGRPVRTVRLRIKPHTSLVVGLDNTAGHPAGWLRILQPISHNKAARTRREADKLGLGTTEHEFGELLAQTDPLPADPKLLKRIAAATVSGKLGRWETSQVPHHNPLRRMMMRGKMHVVRVTTSRDRGVAFDRFIAGVVETPLRLDNGTLDSVSVHAFIGVQDLAGLLAGNPPSRPSGKSRLGRVTSGSDGSWLSRAVSDSDGSWLSRTTSGTSGSCRNHPAVDYNPTQSTPDPVRTIGAVLARLRAAGVPDDLARSSALHTPDPVAQGPVHAALLDKLTLGLAGRIRRVVARFSGAASVILVPSHGDLSPGQVPTARTGDRVWLTDFNCACLAPRAVNLGSFIAVLDDDALLDGYRDSSGQLPPGNQLRRMVATSLTLRAADPLRRASHAWEQEVLANLDRVMKVLK